MYKISGKNILILGGSSDLALSFIFKVLEIHLFPIITYRNNKSLSKINEHLLNINPDKYKLVEFDLENLSKLNELINDNNFDHVVDFIHSDYESLVSMSDENLIKSYFEQNISNRSILLKEISRKMLLQKSGRLIFISSTAALRPNAGQGFYSSAKLAIEALYKNIGIELGSKGISTVFLRFGYISSGRGEIFIEKNKDLVKRIPIGRCISPGEAADNIVFFLSDSSRVINATGIIIDGGLTSTK